MKRKFIEINYHTFPQNAVTADLKQREKKAYAKLKRTLSEALVPLKANNKCFQKKSKI